MSDPYNPRPAEIAGFELCGWKLDDGRVRLGPTKDDPNATVLAEFPKEVSIRIMIYTLEKVEFQDNGFGWGFYV